MTETRYCDEGLLPESRIRDCGIISRKASMAASPLMDWVGMVVRLESGELAVQRTAWCCRCLNQQIQ